MRRSVRGRTPSAPPPEDDKDDQAEINRQTLAAVTKMVKDGNISAEAAMKHAAKLKDVKVRKKGDAQRILLMNMVKDGHLSIEDAMKHAEGMGVDVKAAAVGGIGAGLAAAEGKIYTFGQYCPRRCAHNACHHCNATACAADGQGGSFAQMFALSCTQCLARMLIKRRRCACLSFISTQACTGSRVVGSKLVVALCLTFRIGRVTRSTAGSGATRTSSLRSSRWRARTESSSH